jgi:hypothetical protein
MELSTERAERVSVDEKGLQFQRIQISFFLELPAAGRHTRGWHEQNGVVPLQVLHLPVKKKNITSSLHIIIYKWSRM